MEQVGAQIQNWNSIKTLFSIVTQTIFEWEIYFFAKKIFVSWELIVWMVHFLEKVGIKIEIQLKLNFLLKP